jgi:hypothetical protein
MRSSGFEVPETSNFGPPTLNLELREEGRFTVPNDGATGQYIV